MMQTANVSLGTRWWQAYLAYWQRYADFSGRSTRTEYFVPTIANWVLLELLGLLPGMLHLFYWVFVFAGFVPGIAVAVRRLHDVGLSGKLMWLYFVPFANLYFMAMATVAYFMSTNRYTANFFAWIDRDPIDETKSMTWYWWTSVAVMFGFLILWVGYVAIIASAVGGMM